jgi:hypothetical protein
VTFVVAVELLFAVLLSGVVLLTFAVFEMLPVAPELIATVSVNDADDPTVSVAIEQFTVAPVVQLKAGPEFCCSETKVVPAGRTSVSETDDASAVPLFVTAIVYEMFVPAFALAGPLFTTARSAFALIVVFAKDALLV